MQLLSFPETRKEVKSQRTPPKKKRQVKKRLRESEAVEPRALIPIEESDTDLCISIWQSVIVQVIYDIAGEATSANRAETKASALAWFGQMPRSDGQPTDFEMVCELAQMDPSKVRRRAKAAQERGAEVLDGFNFRTLRKKTSSRKGKK